MIKKKYKYHINKIPEKKLEFEEDFSINVAKWLLEFSALSYLEDTEEILTQLKKCDFVKFEKLIRIDNAECLILTCHDTIIVSFSGTKISELDDLVTDLKFWKEKLENIFVHKGFLEYYYKLKFPVLREIKKLKKVKKHIYWTGHSLGGALATIFAFVYKEGVVYTYGKPKIGDKNFANQINKTIKCYRIYNNLDIVPKLPPGFLKYAHEGNEILGVLDLENLTLGTKIFIFLNKFVDFLPNNFIKDLVLYAIDLRRGFVFHSLQTYRKMFWSNFFAVYIKI